MSLTRPEGHERSRRIHAAEFSKTGAAGRVKKPPTHTGGPSEARILRRIRFSLGLSCRVADVSPRPFLGQPRDDSNARAGVKRSLGSQKAPKSALSDLHQRPREPRPRNVEVGHNFAVDAHAALLDQAPSLARGGNAEVLDQQSRQVNGVAGGKRC